MSLLDDVSIVVTPNGYKAGTLYGVLPTATLGSELLSQSVDLTTDFVANGGGVIVDADTFTSAGGTFDGLVSSTNTFEIGKRYKLIISGNTTSSGFGFYPASGSGSYGDGFGTHYFTATHEKLWVRQQTSGTTNITSFSIKEFTASDMDVTRATAGTRVDENGLVNYAEVLGDSILTGNNSNFDTGIGSWVTYNGGTLAHSTDKLEVTLTAGESGARIDTNSLISGGQSGKTFKVRARIWQGTTSNTLFKIFIGGQQKNIFISSTPTYFEVELTPSNTSMLTIYRAGGVGGVGTYFIDDVTVKEVTRNNVPRIDYTGGGCPHILAEPQRTNLLPYSEDFSNADWSKTNVSVTPNSTTSPQGTINASLIKENSANALHYISDSISVTNGNSYSVSIFAKKKERDVLQISLSTNFLPASYANYDLTTGVVSATGGLVNAEIQTLTNDWYRCKIIFTATSTQSGSPLFVVQNSTTASRNASYQGDGTSGLYLWGAQVEQGSYATSYIPTSGSTVTRNKDIFTRDGIGSLINDSEGVLFAEISALANDSTNRTIGILGDSNNYVELAYRDGANEIRGLIVAGGSVQANMKFTTSDTTLFNKVAVKWKVNDAALWINGVEVLTDTTINTPTGLSELNFYRFDATDNFFGKVKQLQVYDTALTDMQLIQLTGTAGTDFYESYSEMAESLTYTIQ